VPPETKDRITYAALMLFARKGYASTSVADILHDAGVNAGSLYYFFPGKQDVLLAVLDAYLHGIHPMLLQPAWKDVGDPVERVFALLDRYRNSLLTTECTYGCPIGSIALEMHEPDPAVRALLAANFKGWIDAIEQCFVDAGDRFPPTVDRRALAVFALTTMEGGVMISRTDRTLTAFDDAVRMLRDYVDRLQVPPRAAPSTARKTRKTRKTRKRRST
jgi:TetR/AcrR family transcriptional regulator, transcriptional repressor for nem operon